jgi:vacuolar-type H+-ATPase subunit H
MAGDGTMEKAEERMSDAKQAVQGEARDLADKAKTEAKSAFRQVLDDARGQAEQQSSKLAEALRHGSEEMRTMADASDTQSFASTLAREGANTAERLASSLDRGGVDGALAEVRSFARRSPGVFLFGAAAAGFLMGRVVRNVSSDDIKQMTHPNDGSNGSGSTPGFDLEAAGVVEGGAGFGGTPGMLGTPGTAPTEYGTGLRDEGGLA